MTQVTACTPTRPTGTGKTEDADKKRVSSVYRNQNNKRMARKIIIEQHFANQTFLPASLTLRTTTRIVSATDDVTWCVTGTGAFSISLADPCTDWIELRVETAARVLALTSIWCWKHRTLPKDNEFSLDAACCQALTVPLWRWL